MISTTNNSSLLIDETLQNKAISPFNNIIENTSNLNSNSLQANKNENILHSKKFIFFFGLIIFLEKIG